MNAPQRREMAVFLFTLFSVSSWAFDEFPVGARPAAMGEAFTAVADDAHSLYYNPAGLASLYRPEVTAYYARLFPSLSDQSRSAQTFVGGVLPIPSDGRWGGLGVGYQEFRVDSLFKERTVTMAYGRSFLANRLALGVGLKELNRSFGETTDTQDAFSGLNPGGRTNAEDPVFQNGHSKSALGMDLGALYAVLPRFRVGLSVGNVNRPDLGLTQDNRIPLVTRLGAVYDKTYVKLSAGVSQRKYLTSQTDTRLHLGGERQWGFRQYGLLSLRGGVGVGGRDYRQVSLGGGYEVSGLVMDYVYSMPLGASDGTGNLHNVSLSFKFGRSYSEDDLEDELVRERAAVLRAQEALMAAEAEASFIKKERNKLLTEYGTEVERLKSQLEEVKSQTLRPSLAVPEHPLTPAERERMARDRARQSYGTAYDAAMRAYATRVSRGAGLEERADLLKVTLEKYKNKGVNLSHAERELERVQSELAQVYTDYRITMDFYKKTAARGASTVERLSLLERIIKKYAQSGIDLTEVHRETEKLKRPSGGMKP
ncbi:MAG: hypothetical protein JNK54_01145 [Elusimicrobia bacterium]|jgi:hypothetical protein|nr:hypothetical protein [Elusimicrobiota bacterium]